MTTTTTNVTTFITADDMLRVDVLHPLQVRLAPVDIPPWVKQWRLGPWGACAWCKGPTRSVLRNDGVLMMPRGHMHMGCAFNFDLGQTRAINRHDRRRSGAPRPERPEWARFGAG